MTKTILKTSGTIEINKHVESVFDFFANPVNDHAWRTEINKAILDGPLQCGAFVSEYSYLSKKAPDHLLKLQCIEFDKNNIAVFETIENSEFYQKSERMVKAIDANKTEISYTISFNLNIVKHALGFSLPKFIVSMKAKMDLKKYLRQLKKVLESN